jgi:hypothetical protein
VLSYICRARHRYLVFHVRTCAVYTCGLPHSSCVAFVHVHAFIHVYMCTYTRARMMTCRRLQTPTQEKASLTRLWITQGADNASCAETYTCTHAYITSKHMRRPQDQRMLIHGIRWYIHLHTYIYIHTYIHTYIPIHIYIIIRMYGYMDVFLYAYMYVYMYVCMCA